MGRLTEIFSRIKGLSAQDSARLEALALQLSQAQRTLLRELIVTGRAVFTDETYPVSESLLPKSSFATIKPKVHTAETLAQVASLIKPLKETADAQRFTQFAPDANEKLRTLIAPHILGLDAAKNAIVHQLVMPERFHILLLGDPGTGKTDLIRAACDLSPISAFGLGSGASKAGLSAIVIGKEIRPGILAQAHSGLCAIDELNLLKTEDRGALYNAMEKGFLSYDKGGAHVRLDADIRLLATANPTGDRFSGDTLVSMRKQLPFDAALISRFNLICIIRKPTGDALRNINLHAMRATSKILPANDLLFAKAYIATARALTPTMSAEIETKLVDAVMQVSEHEKEYLIEVTPRLATGLRALALAHARINLHEKCTMEDAQAAIEALQATLTDGLPKVVEKDKLSPSPRRKSPKSRSKSNTCKR